MLRQLQVVLKIALVLGGLGLNPACADDSPVYVDPVRAAEDRDFQVQGEYVGVIRKPDHETQKVGIQVMALGGGEFRLVSYCGGLPGADWDGRNTQVFDGQHQADATVFTNRKANQHGKVIVRKEGMTAYNEHDEIIGRMQRIVRRSPTLGQKPPGNAVVLFDGSEGMMRNWSTGRRTPNGLLQQGAVSAAAFGDHTLHVEFRTPFKPRAQGQARGNSGVYLQGRYEVQVLDSFGEPGRNNGCGGIYKVAAPRVNMCLPPLTWQTYDIEFTAAKFNGAGHKTANARMTVRHNGVVVHHDVEVPHPTTAFIGRFRGELGPGPLYLQDHGNPVRFRNIWVIDNTSEASSP